MASRPLRSTWTWQWLHGHEDHPLINSQSMDLMRGEHDKVVMNTLIVIDQSECSASDGEPNKRQI